MNKYKVDIISATTYEVIEQLEMKRSHISNNDFKLIITSMFLNAAISYLNADLVALVYKNNAPCFALTCKTHVNGSTITTDFSVNDKYIYTKTIAC